MKLLQINTSLNTTSTGRITEGIGRVVIDSGHKSYAGYSKIGPAGTDSIGIKIGNEIDRYIHGIKTRVLDLHGFGSKKTTREFIDKIKRIDPDVIGMHNLHGYYLNIDILFNYLKTSQKPLVWTFHDCWPFTGHCAFFDYVNCEKWLTGCYQCPLKTKYPASYGLDNSKYNYQKKKELFTGLENLVIVTPSQWLADLTDRSFLKQYPVKVIHNGVNTDVFSPEAEELPGELILDDRKIVLGVASVWDRRKGFNEFMKLHDIIGNDYRIILVGLDDKQINDLPEGITGIARTENINQLAGLYSIAEVFVNPTFTDNFPTTNIESLACGTPVITYNTGGSPEAINSDTGFVVKQGDVEELKRSILEVGRNGKLIYQKVCREHALKNFNEYHRFKDYLKLYEEIIK